MRTLTIAGTLLGLALVVAACSGGGATTAPATAAPASEAPPSAAPASEPASEAPSESAAAGGPAVNLGETTLGSVVVDGAGKTLYIFTPDSGGTSTCYDECATAWPPLLTGGEPPTVGAGLDAANFATTDRTDGTKQVTFFGMPLYYFAADAAAGDVKGQGLNDKWYVVDAAGTQIK